MTNDNSPALNLKIKKWLVSQGYPLEMLVNKKFKENSDFKIRHGWHYEDPETQKSREIDIVCTFTDPVGVSEINFVIECKNTKKPWILFTDKDTIDGYNRLNSFAIMSNNAYEALAENVFNGPKKNELINLPWFWKEGRIGYGATQALGDNTDIVYKGVLSAVKASTWLQKNSFWQDTHRDIITISFPIVITSSKLFEFYINSQGEEKLKSIEYGFLFFNQHIPNYISTCVTIVNIDGIDNFIKDCNQISSLLSSLLDKAIKEQIELVKRSLEKQKKQ